MGRELSHDDVADLLGAYALDALEPAELQAVDRHVHSCPSCLAEVAQHREVAGLLTPGWGAPPPGVWDKIAASLEDAPPPLDLAPVLAMKPGQSRRATAKREPSRRTIGVGIAAMVAVAAAAVFGFLGLRGSEDGPYGKQLGRSVEAALAAPGARRVDMLSPDGFRTAKAVVLPDGTGYVVETNLPALPNDRTYQLWAVVGSAKVSVGVLGSQPKVVPFKMDGPVSALAITEETAGGVVSSRADPVVLGFV
jgi:anti-sigma factor RsiW